MKYKWLYAPRQASKNLLAAWLLFITFGSPALAAWSVHEPSVIGASTVAYAENSTGQRIEVFVEENGTVVLRLQLGSGFETFSRANCPTFQIDTRKPMHHYEVGNGCYISAKLTRIELGAIADGEIESLVLHRFMNGSDVTFRFTVENGQYRQAQFSLSSSKQSLKRAIGPDTRIIVD
jgi:hypothetical protein